MRLPTKAQRVFSAVATVVFYAAEVATALAVAALVFLWLTSEAFPAEPGGVDVPGYGVLERARANTIGLTGPKTADVGDEVVIRLTGTPPVDLSEPLNSQLDWLMGESRMYCYLAQPGKNLAPLDVRGELVFGIDGATIQPLLRVECQVAGEVRIIVDWNFGQNQLASHQILVGAEPSPGPEPDPTPDPEPDPDPAPDPIPPLPLSKMLVIVVEESADRTPEQARVLLDPTVRKWLDKNGHELRIMDKDSKAPDAQAWIRKATAQTDHVLPRMFVLDNAGESSDVLWEDDLPHSWMEMLDVVKEWGLEK